MPRLLSIFCAAVLVVWLAARVAFFNGYYTEDAPGYVGDAIAIAIGEYGPRNHVNGLNIATYAPVAVPLLLFGKTDAALSVWPLLCSLLGVVSIGAIAAILFGRAYGGIASLLYATYPGDVFFSTVVMPDAIQSGWFSFAMLLIVLACVGVAAKRDLMLLGAGVAMGVCHLIRANGWILLPVGIASVTILSFTHGRDSVRRATARALPLLAGWFLVFVIEGLVYASVVRDFMFRYHVVDRHYGSMNSIAQWGLNINPLTIPYSVFAPLAWARFGEWGQFNPEQAYHGLLFTWALLVLSIGIGLAAVARRAVGGRMLGAVVVAVFWFAWPLLYHEFGSQSLTEFIPIHRLSRHLVVYAPGAIIALVAGCALAWQSSRGRARLVLCVLAITALVSHLSLNVKAERVAYDGYHRIRDTYTRIRDRLPQDTRSLIADPGDLGFFDFWLNPLGEVRVNVHAFANYASCDALTEGVVLTYSNPGWERLSARAIQETVERLPCLLQPPRHWRLLYDGYPERVFVIVAAEARRP
jgi:4-amino-4-deoxy-L-arabinose transferase-like glycosyltransferase